MPCANKEVTSFCRLRTWPNAFSRLEISIKTVRCGACSQWLPHRRFLASLVWSAVQPLLKICRRHSSNILVLLYVSRQFCLFKLELCNVWRFGILYSLTYSQHTVLNLFSLQHSHSYAFLLCSAAKQSCLSNSHTVMHSFYFQQSMSHA